MKKIAVYQVDAFTNEKFSGNPAGVVPEADHLSDREMQLIARELNNSETAFLLRGQPQVCDLHIRYFTPTTEVPSCGHATIASMLVYAQRHQVTAATFRIKTKAGVLEVRVSTHDQRYEVTMTQGSIVLKEPLGQAMADRIIQALGTDHQRLVPHLPLQIVSTGHAKVIIPMKDRKAINRLQPELSTLSQISQEIDCNGFFVYALSKEGSNYLTYGRMFAPAIGIAEDPVTGNANGPLGAYLVHHAIVPVKGDNFTFQAFQGEAMGRPGRMRVDISVHDGKPSLVKVTGNAVMIFSTEIIL